MSTASADAIARHLRACDAGFVPPLSSRVRLDTYAAKLAARALCFEAWDGEALAGLVAAYADRGDPTTGQPASAFITNVSVLPSHRGDGTAARLMQACLAALATRGCTTVDLEVDERNEPAQRLYRRCGFVVTGATGTALRMQLDLTTP